MCLHTDRGFMTQQNVPARVPSRCRPRRPCRTHVATGACTDGIRCSLDMCSAFPDQVIRFQHTLPFWGPSAQATLLVYIFCIWPRTRDLPYPSTSGHPSGRAFPCICCTFSLRSKRSLCWPVDSVILFSFAPASLLQRSIARAGFSDPPRVELGLQTLIIRERQA